jgi:glycosyltransferase involved in cell wall biosynthesis
VSTVDVIIPTRDRAALASEAVDSVRPQTFGDWHVIVVDDGSAEPCRQTLESLQDDRVTIVQRDESGGPQAARQSGYERSTAPYIAPLDSDDLWHPAKLERQMEVFRSSSSDELGAVLAWHAWVEYGRVLRVRQPPVSGRARPLLTDNMSAPLIARWAMEAAEGFPPEGVRAPLPGASHIEFCIRLSRHCSFAVAEEVLVDCRKHPGERASDALRSRDGANNLAYVLDLHSDHLSHYPSDRSTLLARVGARYLACGARSEGLRYLAQGLRAGSLRDAGKILFRYGSFMLKLILRWRRARLSPAGPIG